MNRKSVFFILTSSLLFMAPLFSQNIAYQSVKNKQNSINQDYKIHNLNTSLSYETIQEALNANQTLEGHVIFVEKGIYYEDLVVNRSISLIGENKDATVIDSIGKNVSLKANNIQIKGFTLQNGHYGIFMCSYTNGHSISNNIILNNDYGISGHYDCVNVSICDNIITSNNISGIIMLFSHSTISNNLIFANGKGKFQEWGSGIQIGIGLNSRVIYCENNIITDNTIKNHQIGIWALQYSEDNIFFHNNFVNNTRQLSFLGTTCNNSVIENYWSDYTGADLFSGSYQNETGSDGIGDTPYIIDKNNQDNYPLMRPWSKISEGGPTPFWMQWPFWVILAAGIIVLAGAVYFMKKRVPPASTFSF